MVGRKAMHASIYLYLCRIYNTHFNAVRVAYNVKSIPTRTILHIVYHSIKVRIAVYSHSYI